MDKVGGDIEALWEKHKGKGLLRTETIVKTLRLAFPFGRGVADYWQLEVEMETDVCTGYAIPSDYPPASKGDLYSYRTESFSECLIRPAHYKFKKTTNIRNFSRDIQVAHLDRKNRMLPEAERRRVLVQTATQEGNKLEELPFLEFAAPGWLNSSPAELRLLQDWAESSAGESGEPLWRHWSLSLFDYSDDKGRVLGFTPRWANADGEPDLPYIEPNRFSNIYGLMDALGKFDSKTGCPFSWFFHLVYGNRIDPKVGLSLVSHLENGKIRLKENDERVLLRWAENKYGF